MENNNERSIISFIGDFYESSINKDRIAMNKALDYIENLIGHGEVNSELVRRHFNEVFSGRQAFNTLVNINDYPVESIIRELFQNAFDCCYDSRDIKLAINFKSDNTISLAYNETGFTFENFLRYLGFGLIYGQGGEEYREGRFGIGAKSVFNNVEWLSMRSNNLSFRIVNNNGAFYIEELDLSHSLFTGTEIVFKVNDNQFEMIKDNLSALGDKKGAYINIPELCFAFNKKKVLNYKKQNIEAKDRTFNIAVLSDNRLVVFYKIFNFKSNTANTELIRFARNNKSVVDFICEDGQGLVYLLPFAVSSAAKEGVLRVLGEKYNYFSTYELTGLLKNESEAVSCEKLSSFFISVPGEYITQFRTGIRHDHEHHVKTRVEDDLARIIQKYRHYFVISVAPLPDNSGYCYMCPDSYAFEFVKNFIMTSRFAEDLKNKFHSNISVLFKMKDENIFVPYSELAKTAYSNKISGISPAEHQNGQAYKTYIEKELVSMRKLFEKEEVKTLYASYSWSDENNCGKVFRYEFYRGGKVFVVDSLKNPSLRDFNLHYHFPSVTGYIIKKHLGENNAVKDENALISLIRLLDERYNGDYKITAKTPELGVCFSGEEHFISLEQMKINNIKAVMDALQSHRYRFDTNSAYSEAEKMFMSIFCADGTISELLKGIAANGGVVLIEYDENSVPCFSSYGRKFPVSNDISVKDLLEICGTSVFKDSRLICGRKLGLPYKRIKYLFECETIIDVLGLKHHKKTAAALIEKIRVIDYDINLEKTALFDADEKIIHFGDLPTDEALEETAEKIVLLKNDYTKAETADYIETLLCGECKNILRENFERAEKVNLVLPSKSGDAENLRGFSDITETDLRGLIQIAENGEELNSFAFAADCIGFAGYGGHCSACGFESLVINCFTAKIFKVLTTHNNSERYFVITLYICENCAAASDAWIIKDLMIGGFTPFEWVNKISALKTPFPAEFAEVNLTYKEQIASFGEETDVMLSDEKSLKFMLTPLMTVKWILDNRC